MKRKNWKKYNFIYKPAIHSASIIHADGGKYRPGRVNEMHVTKVRKGVVDIFITDGYKLDFLGRSKTIKAGKEMAEKFFDFIQTVENENTWTLISDFKDQLKSN